MSFYAGQKVTFTARTGRKIKGEVVDPEPKILVLLGSDPYPSPVNQSQITTTERKEMSPTATQKGEAKRLRRDAKNLGVKNWESLRLGELRVAVEEAEHKRKNGSKIPKAPRLARKSAVKKATPKKTVAKRVPVRSEPVEDEMTPARAKRILKAAEGKRGRPSAEVLEARAVLGVEKAKPNAPLKRAAQRRNTKKTAAAKAPAKKAVSKPRRVALDPSNPFREGSNMHAITEELLKGGVRSDIAKRLRKIVAINPWKNDEATGPEAIDKRVTICASTLQNDFGFRVEKEGRGMSGTIKVVPPGAKKASTKKKVAKRR